MKIDLIMLENPIILSDEDIKIGDTVWEDVPMTFDEIFVVDEINSITGIGRNKEGIPFVVDSCRKIIAQSHQINWNGLEEMFGYVYVEKLIKSEYPVDEISFKRGFKKAQELNDKKFSLEDMIGFSVWRGTTTSKEFYECNNVSEQVALYISLSQPKSFSIEVEMEVDIQSMYSHELVTKPKFTDGKIKILKML